MDRLLHPWQRDLNQLRKMNLESLEQQNNSNKNNAYTGANSDNNFGNFEYDQEYGTEIRNLYDDEFENELLMALPTEQFQSGIRRDNYSLQHSQSEKLIGNKQNNKINDEFNRTTNTNFNNIKNKQNSLNSLQPLSAIRTSQDDIEQYKSPTQKSTAVSGNTHFATLKQMSSKQDNKTNTNNTIKASKINTNAKSNTATDHSLFASNLHSKSHDSADSDTHSTHSFHSQHSDTNTNNSNTQNTNNTHSNSGRNLAALGITTANNSFGRPSTTSQSSRPTTSSSAVPSMITTPQSSRETSATVSATINNSANNRNNGQKSPQKSLQLSNNTSNSSVGIAGLTSPNSAHKTYSNNNVSSTPQSPIILDSTRYGTLPPPITSPGTGNRSGQASSPIRNGSAHSRPSLLKQLSRADSIAEIDLENEDSEDEGSDTNSNKNTSAKTQLFNNMQKQNNPQANNKQNNNQNTNKQNTAIATKHTTITHNHTAQSNHQKHPSKSTAAAVDSDSGGESSDSDEEDNQEIGWSPFVMTQE